MADNAPNQIEELLKRYAEKRRQQAGAPFELHPADRQALQGEVARTYGSQRSGARRAGWLAWWPQFGLALGLFLALGVVAWALFHDLNQSGATDHFAKNTTGAAKVSKPDPAGLRTGGAERSMVPAPAVTPIVTNENAPPAPAAPEMLTRRSVEPPANLVRGGIPPPPAPTPAPVTPRELVRTTGEPPPAPAPAMAPAMADAMIKEKAEQAATREQRSLAEAQAKLAEAKLAKAERSRAIGDVKAENGVATGAAMAMRAEPDARQETVLDGGPVVPTVDLSGGPELAKAQTEQRGIAAYYHALTREAADKDQALPPAPALAYSETRPSAARGMRSGAPGGAGGGQFGRGMEDARLTMRSEAPAERERVRSGSIVAGAALNVEEKSADRAPQRQQYAILRETANGQATAAGQAGELLGVFELEIAGERVRIVDADGSVYEGTAHPAEPAATAPAKAVGLKAAAAVDAAKKAPAIAGGQLAFQATGHSRRLGQPVSISGTLAQPPPLDAVARRDNVTMAAPTAPVPGAALQAKQFPAPAPVPLQLRGFVRIGTGPERPLLAVPAK